MSKLTRIAIALSAVLVAGPSAVLAQQTGDQQKCINAINSGAAKMGQIQGKENLSCLKDAGNGALVGTAQTCLSADTDGKLDDQQVKLAGAETKSCSSAPTIAYSSAAIAGSSARTGRLQAFADVFGADLDAALVTCDTNSDGCKCQQAVAKATEKLNATKWKIFTKCKKSILAAGAETAAEVEKCLNDALTPGSVAADSNEKIAKLVAKLTDQITKSCDDAGVTAASFAAGSCVMATGSALASCIDQHVECRVCQTINDIDELATDCDSFDDGLDNSSCGCSPLSTATCDDGVACTIGDVCGGGTCSGTAIAPNLAAAITKQIVSVDEFDVVRLTIEILTLTDAPLSLEVTNLTFPVGFDLESLSTLSCIEEMGMSGLRNRCRHEAVLQATSACQGDGDYDMALNYSCTPAVDGCSLCSAPELVEFTLDTENFCF